jgi:hypothetical protein
MRNKLVPKSRQGTATGEAFSVGRSWAIGQQLRRIGTWLHDDALHSGSGKLVLKHFRKSLMCELARAIRSATWEQ